MSARVPKVRLVVHGRDALDAYMIAHYIFHDRPGRRKLRLNALQLARIVLDGSMERTRD